ncbi:MAG: sigma-70 family RNA polymerase sigma factor [Verrucomicrobia bacterium]|nr:sigma-70 family RNA polymerase sigma factor [Verrucomicrobiota bacterium]
MSDSDPELLARFVEDGCEDSFASLVRRYLGLVYAAALRQVQSPQLAEEIAQSVFLDLARNAPRLAKTTILPAWLYEVTRRTAIDTIRREVRRQRREQTASEMNTLSNDTENWLQIAPLLDDAMQALEELDRNALLLRFFDNQSLRAVGTALGISEDAAQKRVRRALDQLRDLLAQRGVAVASGGLAGLLSSQAAPAVSETLVASIATAALKITPNTIARLGGRAALVSGLRGLLEFGRGPLWTTGALTVALLGGLTWLAARNATSRGPASSLSQSKIGGGSPLEIDPSTSLASPVVAEILPDPLDLLVGVARARQQVVSGVTEFSITTTIVGEKSMRDQTNEVQVKVLFAGGKLRSESVGKEYSYTVGRLACLWSR